MVFVQAEPGAIVMRCSLCPTYADDLGTVAGVGRVMDVATDHERAEHPAPAPHVAPDVAYEGQG
jgi:hypothetical protein